MAHGVRRDGGHQRCVRAVGARGPGTTPADARPTASRRTPVKPWDLLTKPSFVAIVAGAACISMAGYSLTAFAPAFLMRARGMSLGEVGVQYGVTSGLTGILGLLLVGRLADRLSSNDFRWLLWLVAAMTATMIPFSAMAFVVDNRSLAVLFISLSYVGTAYMAPSIAAIQRLARAEQRATASAIFLFFSAIVGSAGPFLTGVISDALRPDLGNMALGGPCSSCR